MLILPQFVAYNWATQGYRKHKVQQDYDWIEGHMSSRRQNRKGGWGKCNSTLCTDENPLYTGIEYWGSELPDIQYCLVNPKYLKNLKVKSVGKVVECQKDRDELKRKKVKRSLVQNVQSRKMMTLVKRPSVALETQSVLDVPKPEVCTNTDKGRRLAKTRMADGKTMM